MFQLFGFSSRALSRCSFPADHTLLKLRLRRDTKALIMEAFALLTDRSVGLETHSQTVLV